MLTKRIADAFALPKPLQKKVASMARSPGRAEVKMNQLLREKVCK